MRELQAALGALAGGGADPEVVRGMAASVADGLMARAAERLAVEPDTLFPFRRALLAAVAALPVGGGGAAGAAPAPAAAAPAAPAPPTQQDPAVQPAAAAEHAQAQPVEAVVVEPGMLTLA